MDEIFKKIQDVEKFVNKREQYAVLEAIHGKEEIEPVSYTHLRAHET